MMRPTSSLAGLLAVVHVLAAAASQEWSSGDPFNEKNVILKLGRWQVEASTTFNLRLALRNSLSSNVLHFDFQINTKIFDFKY